MEPVLDVVGVGNAIVDVIASVDDSFIVAHGLVKGAMTLVSAERSAELYDAMPTGIAASGGSAANTVAGAASFGGRAAFIGKVRDDQLGEVFVHDIRATGVAFDVPPAPDGPPTARCLIQVTPDAERTMNTFLGTSALLGPDDVDTGLVASAGITYCEGYLWDVQVAKDAIRVAMEAAGEAGRTVALALSDSYCVERHRAEWLDLIEDRVDVVFANEAEVCALHSTGDLAVAFRHQATRKVYRDSTVTLDGVLFELPSTLIGAHLSRDRGGIVVARPGAARHRAVVRPGHRTRVAVPPHEPVTNAAPRSYSMIAPIMLPSPRRRPGSRKTTRSCERSSVWILGTDMPGSFRGVVLGRPMEARRWQYSPFGVSAILRIP